MHAANARFALKCIQNNCKSGLKPFFYIGSPEAIFANPHFPQQPPPFVGGTNGALACTRLAVTPDNWSAGYSVYCVCCYKLITPMGVQHEII